MMFSDGTDNVLYSTKLLYWASDAYGSLFC
jgi:hypothetical protein